MSGLGLCCPHPVEVLKTVVTEIKLWSGRDPLLTEGCKNLKKCDTTVNGAYLEDNTAMQLFELML